MKIAIPTENGLLCPHFGHCQLFAIIDVDPESRKIESIDDLTPPPHDIGVLPAWLHDMGCTHIIAGGMGARAVMLFQRNGIEVVCGAQIQSPENLVKAYLENQLQKGSNYCEEPGFKLHGRDDCGNH